jgi:RNA-directed DNA polymerase
VRRDPLDHVARALAWGFLAAPEWDEPSLIAAGRRTVGNRPRWLAPVVREVLSTYRVAPVDRPSELAGVVVGVAVLGTAVERARRRGNPVRVVQIATVPGRMGARRWPVPVVDDLPALARLLEVPMEQLPWIADVKGQQRRTPAGPYHLYRYTWISRPNTVPRLLEAPTPLLRETLRRLLAAILIWVPLHPAAHGFVRGRSVSTHAGPHVGQHILACLDLRTFFAAITSARVNGLFVAMGYPEAVARTLTGLTTHRTPGWVLARMPPGGDSRARHKLRTQLRMPHLPQGAPTSPGLANLAAFTLDRRLAGYAAALGLTYTRYADDLAFSGPVGGWTPTLPRAVGAIAGDEGFALNPAKTRVRPAGQRQLVTGVVVNERPGVPRELRERLRAVLHDAATHGVEAANRERRPDFRGQLDGRIGWVESVNPSQGRRLRRQFDAVTWPS